MNKKCLLINKSYINYTIHNKNFSTPSNTVETEVYKLCFDFCGDYCCKCTPVKNCSSNYYTCNSRCIGNCNSCNYFYRPRCVNNYSYCYTYNHIYCFMNKNDFPLYDVKIEIIMEKDMRLLNQEIKINNKTKDIQNDSYDYYIPFIKSNSEISIFFITDTFKLVKNNDLVSSMKIEFHYFDVKGNYNSALAYYSIFAY